VNGKEAEKHSKCLSDEVLTDYLEATLDPVVRSACEAHLIACDPCREKLALFMKVLRDDVTPEEEAAVQELAALWEERNPRPVPMPRRSRLSSRRWIYAAGVAAVLLAAVLISRLPFGSQASTAKEITDALVANVRPFEPRIVGQPYLAVQEVTRGPEDLVPVELEREMTEKSAESYEVGRFFLIRKNYPKAIKYLRTAVSDPKGVPADVHNDLGVAYLESGESSFAAAEQEFKDALNRNRVHAPAVFNLLILYERQGRFEEARQRREEYLSLDSKSGWAKEAQKKLSGREPAER
jgi:tetratricopeptide (TPR) repeat protein